MEYVTLTTGAQMQMEGFGVLQVTGTIGSNDFYAPKTIAEEFWKLYTEQETFEIVH